MKYVGFYEIKHSKLYRNSTIAAINKMNYITEVLRRSGASVNIISPSWMGKNSSVNFIKNKRVNLNEKVNVTFFPSWKHRTKVGRNLKIVFSLTCLFLYLLVTTRKNEKIIVYHSQWLSWPVRWSKYIRKYHVILEVEEIYGEVWKNSKLLNHWEKKLLDSADSYILVSDKLQERFNKRNKKSLVLYGAYEPKYTLNDSKLEDNFIHLVYAGSIDRVKGGAFQSLEIARRLPLNYKLHILGGGNEECLNELKETIKSINSEKGYEAILYKGILHGKDFTDYLNKCNIALNPQNQGEYMNTAFPSKVITYLAHNLDVVSTPIESIRFSKIAKYIKFSKGDSVSDFIKTITPIEGQTTNKYSNIIAQLDREFTEDLNELLER